MKTLNRSGSRLILENNTITFSWLVMTLFNLGVVLTTGLIVTDRYPLQDGEVFPWWVIAIFWLGAIAGSIWAYSKTRTCLIINHQGGTITRIDILFRTSQIHFKPHEVQRLEVLRTTDVDGDPYFYCELAIAGQKPVRVAEGHFQNPLEDVLQELRQTIGLS
ncbi:MAG: hypothetical protein F6J87_23730 [Spirulina sp. SIO3F2]|nr:hypothetical protein [Spirulina sp. SIO3F2]